MSETATKPRVANPFDGGMQFEQPAGPAREMIPVGPGAAADRATAAIITAQRVAIKRNLPAILSEAKALATAAGDRFYYSMPFKEKDKDGNERTVLVEGPSIGCAMAALSCYGNDCVEAFPASETQTHWTFLARFTDYEKGVTVTRSFNQRKGQNVGIRDRGRSEDLVFQIGQSKAIRNVIIGGLKWLTDEMFAAAKNGVLDRIHRAPDKAREWIVHKLEQGQVPLHRVERVVGRVAERWTARDMARIFAELQAIEDGFADAEDLYPASQTDAEQMREDIDASQKDATASEAGASGTSEGEKSSSASTDATPQNTGTAAGKAATGEAEKVTRKRAPKEKPVEKETSPASSDPALQQNEGAGEKEASKTASLPSDPGNEPEGAKGESSSKPTFLDQLADHQAKQAVEAGATTVVVDPLQQRMEEEAELEDEEDEAPPKSTPPEPSGELEFQ